MYYEPGVSIKGCRYAKIQEAMSREGMSKDIRKRTVCHLFSIDEADLGVAVRRVVAVLCASEYFEYVYEKSILDARPKELTALAKDENRYLLWRPSARKVSFEDLVQTISFLQTNLT